MGRHDHHDDFGGLHRDLLQTGASIDRRRLLRHAARLGAGFSALKLLGCAIPTDAAASTSDDDTTTTVPRSSSRR